MNIKHLIALATLLLSGCALTPAELASLSNAQLCDLNGTLRLSPLNASDAADSLQEITRRNLVTDEELKLINARIVQTGMSECAMRAAWGNPDSRNNTLTAGRNMTQHVYRRGKFSAQYVYTVNGIVTSIQTTGQ